MYHSVIKCLVYSTILNTVMQNCFIRKSKVSSQMNSTRLIGDAYSIILWPKTFQQFCVEHCGLPENCYFTKTISRLFNNIMLTSPCNVYPLTPHFYILKLGFTGVYIIFLIFASKHRLWVLVRAASVRRF